MGLLTVYPLKASSVSSTTGVRTNPVTGRVEGHAGVDFAAPDGSPIYAAHDGVVQYLGAAEGFGQWIVLKGTGVSTVYGHMWNSSATGLHVGDKVQAGQLIAYVGSNGQSTGPHLHFEVHIPTYSDSRVNVVDPLKYLATCPRPGILEATGSKHMVSNSDGTKAFYGFDISNHQRGFNVADAKAEGFSFCFFKASEGNYFTDPTYKTFSNEARACGILFAAYHFLTTDDVNSQADVFANAVGDTSVPVMIDMESTGASKPLISHYAGFKTAVEKRGYKVCFSYIPRWYWNLVGSPSLAGVPGLIASNYVQGAGYASVLAQKITPDALAPYGGATPSIVQFTDSAKIAGFPKVDANLFTGTAQGLQALFNKGGKMFTPTQQPQAQGVQPLDRGFFVGYMNSVASDVKDIRQEITGSRDLVVRNGKIDEQASFPGIKNGQTLPEYLVDLGTKVDQIGLVVSAIYKQLMGGAA